MKRFYSILIFLLALTMLTACGAPKGSILVKENFKGTEFEIDFSEWSNHYTCKMSLNQDDAIQVEIICESGHISLDIRNNNGVKAYSGNNLKEAKFVVRMPSNGEYLLAMEGDYASGTVVIKKLSR